MGGHINRGRLGLKAQRRRLENLDNSWPVLVVIFSSLAIGAAWFTIPPGA